MNLNNLQTQPLVKEQTRNEGGREYCECCSEKWHSVYPHSTAPGVWHVPSSRGAYHLVTRIDNGEWRCSCVGNSFGRVCRHIKGEGGALDMELRLAQGGLPAIHLKYIPK